MPGTIKFTQRSQAIPGLRFLCAYLFYFDMLAYIAPFLTPMWLLKSAFPLDYHSLSSVVLASSSEWVTRSVSVLPPQLSGA